MNPDPSGGTSGLGSNDEAAEAALLSVGSLPRVSVVMPVFNAAKYLPQTLKALRTAAESHGNVEVIIVDNWSTDDSPAVISKIWGDRGTILRSRGTVGAVRNAGAAIARGELLSFLDADCLIPADYFQRVIAVMDTVDCEATGSRYDLPDAPHWIERVWHMLHSGSGDGDVAYINAGNFVVRRSAFNAAGGFDAGLTSGEDAELCVRLRQSGARVYESHDVRAIHLGNPKTLRSFGRKQIWHGEGALGTARHSGWDRPLILTIFHVASAAAGTAYALFGTMGSLTRVLILAGAWLVAPALAVTYRGALGRPSLIIPGLLLYCIYFSARALSLLRLASRRAAQGRHQTLKG